jgi:hypothetical protein
MVVYVEVLHGSGVESSVEAKNRRTGVVGEVSILHGNGSYQIYDDPILIESQNAKTSIAILEKHVEDHAMTELKGSTPRECLLISIILETAALSEGVAPHYWDPKSFDEVEGRPEGPICGIGYWSYFCLQKESPDSKDKVTELLKPLFRECVTSFPPGPVFLVAKKGRDGTSLYVSLSQKIWGEKSLEKINQNFEKMKQDLEKTTQNPVDKSSKKSG